MNTTDQSIIDILERTNTIALVGYSANPDRPAHSVARFLKARGYRVLPVNPGLAGQEALGETIFARISDIGEKVDMVDVFRNSDALPEIVDEILTLNPLPNVLWTQLNVIHDGAANRARQHGLEVVQNRCPVIEMPRLNIQGPKENLDT